MSTVAVNQYNPDYAVHPGEILEETLDARGIKKTEFAQRCGLSVKTVSQIINCKAPVSPETAIQFERVLGVSANIWNNLDAHYRLHQAKIANFKELQRKTAWAKNFPITQLVKGGWIAKPASKADTVDKLLGFLGAGTIKAWQDRFKSTQVAYRSSSAFKSSPEAVAAWLRACELEAEDIDTASFDATVFKNNLLKIRAFTEKGPEQFEPQVKQLCAESGVAVVLVPEFPGTRLSGATRWLSKDKALLMLSLRHKSDDHFWFSFFHEAAHIFLHGKKMLFVDEIKSVDTPEEHAANRFAANMLIPDQDFHRFVARDDCKSKTAILVFAKDLVIAPGIVVGRLQHEGIIPFSWHADLKRTFELVA
ncbi:MAG: HigA family addiction module antidote protein [Proteobacteria bacterium]|nr:HigA family addiction module antidote protein [Pseudomonadota bacterium]MBU1716655.1 HigA family addiction module antidote protein [Pseudomonadota bacterium]